MYAGKDMVNHPIHYTQGDIECWEAECAMAGKENFILHCALSAFKYIWRYRFKNGLEDLKKARWWIDKAIQVWEQNDSKA